MYVTSAIRDYNQYLFINDGDNKCTIPVIHTYIDYVKIIDDFKEFFSIDNDNYFKANRGKPLIFTLDYEPYKHLKILEIQVFPNGSKYLLVYHQMIDGHLKMSAVRPISIYNITGINLKIFMLMLLDKIIYNELVHIKLAKVLPMKI